MDIFFLTMDEVTAIHQDQLSHYGGSDGIRDARMLDAALAQPKSTFGGVYLHPDIYSMAGAYLYHIAANHPFIDGNKRTALVSALVFLELNGHGFEVDEGTLERFVLDIADGKVTKNEVASFFKSYTVDLLRK